MLRLCDLQIWWNDFICSVISLPISYTMRRLSYLLAWILRAKKEESVELDALNTTPRKSSYFKSTQYLQKEKRKKRKSSVFSLLIWQQRILWLPTTQNLKRYTVYIRHSFIETLSQKPCLSMLGMLYLLRTGHGVVSNIYFQIRYITQANVWSNVSRWKLLKRIWLAPCRFSQKRCSKSRLLILFP